MGCAGRCGHKWSTSEVLFAAAVPTWKSSELLLAVAVSTSTEPTTHPRNPSKNRLPIDGYRSPSGTHSASFAPVYFARGRMMRLSSTCSSTWATQPPTRLIAKIGVNMSTGIPSW